MGLSSAVRSRSDAPVSAANWLSSSRITPLRHEGHIRVGRPCSRTCNVARKGIGCLQFLRGRPVRGIDGA